MLQTTSLNILLEYIIPITQFLILLIPFLGSGALYDKRKKYYRRFSVRGYSLVFLAIFLIICSVKQNEITEELNEIKDKEVSVRDSINQYRTQELLAKYGLKVDRKNDEIVRILRDSSLSKTTIINGAQPYLNISNIEMKRNGDTLGFKIWYCSEEAISYNLDVLLDIYAYKIERDSFSVVVENLRDISSVTIPKDRCIINDSHRLIGRNNNDEYIFFLHGTYENSTHKKIKANYLSSYNFPQKHFGGLTPEHHVDFMKFLQKKSKSKLNKK